MILSAPRSAPNRASAWRTSAAPSAFLSTLQDCGALLAVLPEVAALYGVPQRAEFHPEVDTGVHVELVLEMAARLAPGDDVVGFGALTHDLGKARTPEHVLPKHLGHEHAGLEPLAQLCERLKVPTAHRRLAEVACREHLNVHRLAELRDDTVHDLLARCDGFRQPSRITQLALVCEADKRGRAGHQDNAYPQGPELRHLLEVASAVRAADVVASLPEGHGGLQGPSLRQGVEHVGSAHGAGRFQQADQFRSLRIGVVAVAGAAALVGFADDRQPGDARGLAETVAAREQVVHGVVAQFGQAVHVEVFAARDLGQPPVRERYLQPFAQFRQRLEPAVLVAQVPR